MRTYLVTGGAGFIGSNYIHYMTLCREMYHAVNVSLQKMTLTAWYISRQRVMLTVVSKTLKYSFIPM